MHVLVCWLLAALHFLLSMLLLPPFYAGSSRPALPMADGSGAALADLLLGGDPPARSERLIEVLCGDPPLLLWAVCTAADKDDLRPRRVPEVARWLADRAFEVLAWPEGSLAEPSDEATGETYADLVEVRLQIADLAAHRAREGDPAEAEFALLLGLLYGPEDWFLAERDAAGCETAEGGGENGGSPALPRWLAELDPQQPAAAAVQFAASVFSGEAGPQGASEAGLDDCRRRAAEGRRRWLEPAAGLGERLPVLAPKLARLAVLETQFGETLEREKLEALAEFAAGAGHEINNPLTVIAGRAQLFLRDETDPERRRALALMNSQAMRVHEMIADMRLFARPPKPEPEPVDVVALVDGLVEGFLAAAERQQTVLRRTGADGPVEIEVDPVQLTVALRAVVQNALEAIGRGGQIEIDVRPGEDHLEIRVIDDGPGIPPEERRHIFDPYYSARQAGRGLGLGLSKAWRIVTNHGGRIDVESSPGRGTVFTITLPRL